MNANALPDRIVFEAIMNAVIIYDDFACAAKAKAMFERAAHRADEVLRWTVKPWRFDMLMPSLSADAALADAADAHLVVLSLRHPLPLPAWVQDWLERWAARRQIQEAALAVWDGGNGDNHSVPAVPELSRFAGRHGLSFITRDAGSEEDETAAFGPSPHEWEMPATVAQGQVPEQALHPAVMGTA
jgi:hypothetical protein